MGVSLRQVIGVLGEAFPWELAVKGDNCGILLGSRQAEVEKALCSIDLTGKIVDAAVENGHQVLVTHHPQFFMPPPGNLDLDSPAGSLVRKALDGGLNIASCHSNADAAEGGTADLMADRLGLNVCGPLLPSTGVCMMKVVVFAPEDALEDAVGAMVEAGAVASDLPVTPAVEEVMAGSGQPGASYGRREARVEIKVPSFRLERATESMLSRHPHDEISYDVYRLEADTPWGIGRVGLIREGKKVKDIFDEMAQWCRSKNASLHGDPERVVRKVAVVPGAAKRCVGPARNAGCELMVTGEVDWHAVLEAEETGLALICLGHLESERALVPRMVQVLEEASQRYAWGLEVEGYLDEKGEWG